jgi:hypothetical protein
VRAATSGGTGGVASGGGVWVGVVLVAVGLGGRDVGVRVVTVSGGRAGTNRGVVLRLGGTTTVAEVEELSPPLTITTLAITASTKTIPAMTAVGRQRPSADEPSPSA